MDVGVRELRAKLSAMLQRAEAGEVITVTDRGQPVAALGPPLGARDLSAAAHPGCVTPPTSRGLAPVRRYRASAPVLDALGEDRRE
jgi:prevent-host-death family protein